MGGIWNVSSGFVDDHLFLLRRWRWCSLEHDIRVTGIITDGSCAVDTIVRERPDVVVLDYHLPGAKWDRRFRKSARTVVDTKVILLTSETSDDIVLDAIEAGASRAHVKNQAVERSCRQFAFGG